MVPLRLLAILAFVLVLTPALFAHDIPAEVRVHAFLRAEGQRLQLLMRVPLQAMRDVDVPRRGGGFLDLERAPSALRDAVELWLTTNIDLYEGEVKLASPRIVEVRVSLESQRVFTSWELARAHLKGPRLPNDTQIYWNQGLLDVLIEYPVASEQSAFSIDSKLARLGLKVATVLRFQSPGGVERVFEYHGDPGLVRLDPSWHQAAARFVHSGFLHILSGADHLLFLLCLVIPFRRFLPLVAVVTAFTVAHSATLIAAALGFGPSAAWFPSLIETLIALSIVYMALENIVGVHLRWRWFITFAFGLAHGFGFSFALREELQFAGSHLLTSLLAFNAGVELGQLLVLVVILPSLALLFRYLVAERIGAIIISALIAHSGWHWMLERGEQLSKFPLPVLAATQWAYVLRWLMAIVIALGTLWIVRRTIQRRATQRTRSMRR